ncbi:hypothetical protein CEXT_803881 [Caerostris extrusa]|uniref:Uncharacterized protein n=1 Tax=Caerostris extrusa TaxID=172846 RepID=A0AAV4Y3S5_CAEEX|nr:hypothetical protein CEXT_803881 [Caerostris extrusa]
MSVQIVLSLFFICEHIKLSCSLRLERKPPVNSHSTYHGVWLVSEIQFVHEVNGLKSILASIIRMPYADCQNLLPESFFYSSSNLMGINFTYQRIGFRMNLNALSNTHL